MNASLPILSALGQAALDYAARGWPVFPVKPRAKEPLVDRGCLEATTNAAQVRQWWTRWPDANIGLHLAAAGLVAVDADTYKPECRFGTFMLGRDMPDTLIQRSARGGTHFIFRAAAGEEFDGKLCDGVDIKHRGYVLLEPSTFEGGVYQWQTDSDPAPAPEWVPRKRKPKLSEQAKASGPRIDTTGDDARAKAMALLWTAPNTLDRDDWAKLCNATKHALGEDARPAWLAFCARWPGEQKPGEAERVWNTAKPDGSAGIGSIFHLLRGPTETRREEPPKGEGKSGLSRLRSFRDLQQAVFPPARWIVPGFLPEGLTIFIGPPKVGKSALTLDLARAVASGGTVLGQTVEQGAVLLLALEDNPRRLQSRLDAITGEEDWPQAAVFSTRWDRLDLGGIKLLVEWLDATPNARLIIIDTLKMVRPPAKKGQGVYDADVEVLRPLQQLASERGVSIVIVHHTKKGAAEDPLELISGTNGLTGTADTTVVLTRRQGGKGLGQLYARGRDLEEFDRPVKLAGFRWEIDGEPLDATKGDTARAILKAIRDGANTTAAIVRATGIAEATVRKQLTRMADRGDVIRTGRGTYEVGGASQASQASQEAEREGQK